MYLIYCILSHSVIRHHNPSVRITIYLIPSLMHFLYNFTYCQTFCQKYYERNSPKKSCFIFRLFEDIWPGVWTISLCLIRQGTISSPLPLPLHSYKTKFLASNDIWQLYQSRTGYCKQNTNIIEKRSWKKQQIIEEICEALKKDTKC